jgi:hypothetical protein
MIQFNEYCGMHLTLNLSPEGERVGVNQEGMIDEFYLFVNPVI